MEVFFFMFLRPSGVMADKHTLHFGTGSVRHEMLGTHPDVPVPTKIMSTTVAISVLEKSVKREPDKSHPLISVPGVT